MEEARSHEPKPSEATTQEVNTSPHPFPAYRRSETVVVRPGSATRRGSRSGGKIPPVDGITRCSLTCPPAPMRGTSFAGDAPVAETLTASAFALAIAAVSSFIAKSAWTATQPGAGMKWILLGYFCSA